MSSCLAGLLALALVPGTMGAAAAGELDTLVQGLADEVYATRESSTAELIQRARGESDPVWKLVLKHFRSDPEPEVRLRCEVILRDMADNYGFLGVQHRERTYFSVDGKSHRGVELMTIIEGQPAHAAGLKVGDIVIEIDGKSLDIEDTVNLFGSTIRLLGAGRQTTVKIDRLGEVLTIPITTGAPPKELGTIDPEARFQEWLKAHEEPAGP